MFSNVERRLALAAALPPVLRLALWIRTHLNRRAFAPFPKPHLRSNGFLISREMMNRVWPGFVATKRWAHLWESGRKGFTRCVQGLNMRVLFAGKDGRAYASNDWPRSGTFRQGNQENLLLADNQSRGYDEADAPTRRQLSVAAWGADLSALAPS